MTVHAVANQLGIKIFTLTLSSCLLPREDPSKSSSYSCSLLFLGDCSTKVCSSSSLDWSRSAGGSSKLAVSPALLSGRVSSRRLAISESCSFAPLPNYQENKSHFKLPNFCPWRLKHRIKNFTTTQIRLTPFFLRFPLNAFPKKNYKHSRNWRPGTTASLPWSLKTTGKHAKSIWRKSWLML